MDISNDLPDVAVLSKKRTAQFANTKQGLAKRVRYMKHLKPKFIEGEATGGYEEALVLALFAAGLPVAQVRQYARAKGLVAKTDQIDGYVLAELGKKLQPRLFVGKSEEHKRLSARVGRRNQLNAMLQAKKNRLRTTSLEVKNSLVRVIACTEELEQEIQQFMNTSEEFAEQRNYYARANTLGA